MVVQSAKHVEFCEIVNVAGDKRWGDDDDMWDLMEERLRLEQQGCEKSSDGAEGRDDCPTSARGSSGKALCDGDEDEVQRWKVLAQQRQEDVEALKTQLAALMDQRQEDSEFIRARNSEIGNLQDQLRQTNDSLRTNQEEVRTFALEVINLNAANETMSNELAKLGEYRANAEQEMKKIKASETAKTKEVNRLQEQLKESAGLQPKVAEQERLSARLLELMKELDDAKVNLETQLRERDDTVRGMEVSMKKLQEQLETDGISSELASAEIGKLTAEVKAAEQSLLDKSEEISVLNAKLEESKDELCKEKKARNEEIEQFHAVLGAKEKEVTQLDADLKTAESQAKKLNDIIESKELVIEMNRAERERSAAEIAELQDHLRSEHDKSCADILIIREEHSSEVAMLKDDFSAQVSKLQDELQAANESLVKKTNEIFILTRNAESFATVLEELEKDFKQKMSDERGPRLEKARVMETSLLAQEKEVIRLTEDIKAAVSENKRMQSVIDSMELMVEPSKATILELREWKHQASERIQEQDKEMDGLRGEVVDLNTRLEEAHEKITNNETEISFLCTQLQEREQLIAQKSALIDEMRLKIDGFGQQREEFDREKKVLFEKLDHEASVRYEQELLTMSKEKGALMDDVQAKLDVISNLINDNSKMVDEINELTRWKEETEQLQLKKDGKTSASDVLSQKIIDLENEVDQYRVKYQESTKALRGMEEALLVVEQERIRLVSKSGPDQESQSRSDEELDGQISSASEDSNSWASEDDAESDSDEGSDGYISSASEDSYTDCSLVCEERGEDVNVQLAVL